MAINQNRVFFVNTSYIFANYAGYLDNNLDPNSLNTFIQIAQAEQTQQLLGYTLYQKFITDINNGNISQPADVNYKYLLDNFLVDSISMWTIYYSYDTIQFRSTNKSIELKNSPGTSTAINDKQLNRLKHQIQERAQFVDTRCRFYILNNPGFYPEYFNISSIYQLAPKQTTYINAGSLYLPNRGNWGSNLTGDGNCGYNYPGRFYNWNN